MSISPLKFPLVEAMRRTHSVKLRDVMKTVKHERKKKAPEKLARLQRDVAVALITAVGSIECEQIKNMCNYAFISRLNPSAFANLVRKEFIKPTGCRKLSQMTSNNSHRLDDQCKFCT